MDVESVVRAATVRGGAVTWAELRHEVSRRAVGAAVQQGVLVRVARGAYCLPRSPDALRAAVA